VQAGRPVERQGGRGMGSDTGFVSGRSLRCERLECFCRLARRSDGVQRERNEKRQKREEECEKK
jgi:hypothetical protein